MSMLVTSKKAFDFNVDLYHDQIREMFDRIITSV